MDEHRIKLEELYRELDCTPAGLSSEQARNRLRQYGQNIMEVKEHLPLILRFLKQFANFFAILMIVGSALAFLADYLSPGEGNLYIGIALLGVVILNALFTFIQEYQSERIMESFRKMLPSTVQVLRDGKLQEIPAADVFPGDIIYLEEGDKVPADGRLIEQNGMKVDSSSITGESEPQLRKLECTHDNIMESRNMVFSGTLVQTGNGKAVVYATGMDTKIGEIIKLTKQTKEVSTPLRREIDRFVRIISGIALSLGVLFFIVSVLTGHQLLGSIIFAIGIIVANVPEGLLPTVTLSLSMAAKRMAKKNALIKNLESVETLGSTTVICTDKTGTITENRMSVNTLVLGLNEYNVDGRLSRLQDLPLLLRNMALCNNARTEGESFHGDPTETSLLHFARDHSDLDKLLEDKRVHESPFDSKSKRMISTNLSAGRRIAYMKGAPEVVLKMCNQILDKGTIRQITSAEIKSASSFYRKLASRGERVLAFAYKETTTDKASENRFIFIGLCGMIDPPRKEIAQALLKCRTAGIKVIMITGDYSLTAEAIARKVGLIRGEVNIIDGSQLSELSDEELKDALHKENLIFSRSNPMQKLRIVQALQSMGETVTVTGDGVNDAPALKNADMGVSMGLNGTEVAREASDMVLLDDNFATIVSAVEEGRTIFDNLKKFVAYILTSNVPEILPFIAFVILRIPLPMTVVLILAIDLGTDLLPALGLGTESSESDVMKKAPRHKDERLMSNRLLFMSYGIIGMIQAAAGFFSYFFVLYSGGWQWGQQLDNQDPLYLTAVTAFFASIVICQMADVMICRTRRQSVFKVGLFSNRLVLLGIASELILLAVILYFPPANTLFGTAPLSMKHLLLPVPFALLILFGDEFRKLLVRKENRFVTRWLTW